MTRLFACSACSERLHPLLRLGHGGLHAGFDHEAVVFDHLAVGVGGNEDRRGNHASGWAERPWHRKAIPTLGSPGVLERHSRSNDRQTKPAGEVDHPLVDASPGPFGTVGGDAKMAFVDPVRHLLQGPNSASCGRASDHPKSKPAHDLRDQLAVPMVADQNLHLGPRPVKGWEEHDLMIKSVDISNSQASRDRWVDGRVGVTEVEWAGPDQAAHKPSAADADRLYQQWMSDLHVATPPINRWLGLPPRPTRQEISQKWKSLPGRFPLLKFAYFDTGGRHTWRFPSTQFCVNPEKKSGKADGLGRKFIDFACGGGNLGKLVPLPIPISGLVHILGVACIEAFSGWKNVPPARIP